MGNIPLMSRQIASAMNDMLDNCASVQPGEEVLILAHVDGLHGGSNIVDEETIAWTQSGVYARGGHPSVLWVDEPASPLHAWRVPPVLKGAMAGADVLISYSFDLETEEVHELGQVAQEHGVRLIRSYASTAALLGSAWARTPHDLVAEIRMQAGAAIKQEEAFTMTDPNGTHLEGKIGAIGFQLVRRKTPFPEWVYPPINLIGVEGVLVFDRMLSWWSRYIGIPPFFKAPVRIPIQKGRMMGFEGGAEADALRAFYRSLADRFGEEGVYDFSAVHAGIHPNASVSDLQCPDPLRQRFVEHAHTSNIHFHLGTIRDQPGWPYMLHVTADIRHATWQLGNEQVVVAGRPTALDHPAVLAVAARYPDLPGLTPGELWRQ